MSDNHKRMIPIPEGALLTITTGEYSSYNIRGVFRAMGKIDAENLLRQWFAAHPKAEDLYSFEEDEFVAWLALQGLIEPVECFEWHLKNYGAAEGPYGHRVFRVEGQER